MSLQETSKKVLVGGCFDILHYGHIVFLEAARREGDVLVVALESDDRIRLAKKRHPIHTQNQRAHTLKALTCVDEVLCLPLLTKDQDYFDLVIKVSPTIIATTAGDPQLSNKRKQAQKCGGQVKIVTPLLKEFSSSKILQLLGENL